MIWTANINIQLANNEMLMMPIIVIMWTMSLCWEFKVQCDGTGKRSGLLGRVAKPSVANRNACRLRSVEASAYEKRSNTTTGNVQYPNRKIKIPSSTIGVRCPVEWSSSARASLTHPLGSAQTGGAIPSFQPRWGRKVQKRSTKDCAFQCSRKTRKVSKKRKHYF